jgi:phosphodiesterase/alkaline phosphatase D-like protein
MWFPFSRRDGEENFMPHVRVGPLVRATSTNTVILWAELSEHCDVQIHIVPDNLSEDAAVTISTTTVQVGEHYFIAPQVQGLKPSTWYTYTLTPSSDDQNLTTKHASTLIQCFRTFDKSVSDTDRDTPPRDLRVAYGSCRKAEKDLSDALRAFGTWLPQHFAQREEIWPHLLLLIGDQIYADQPPAEAVQLHPRLRGGARTFEDFCALYIYAWTNDPAIQQALAAIPTFMIFDDHEIINNWKVEPAWQSKLLDMGGEQLLIDGLVAYWVYQGWGNLTWDTSTTHPLLAIMHDAARSGEDALEKLRGCVRADIYQHASIRWHYSILTQPAIFVANARTERTTIVYQNPIEVCEPLRIMSEEQMQDIEQWLEQQDFPIFVSSVPVLLPPLIGLLQYLVGERIWVAATYAAPLRWLGRRIAHAQKFIAARLSFDHWPLYITTWHEFLNLIRQRQREIIILSGDVHFSYALTAVSRAQAKKLLQRTHQAQARLYQFVSTPLQNDLGEASERKVKLQAFITHIAYSGLRLHMLPLRSTGTKAHIDRQILFENTLAFLTLHPEPDASYQIKNAYMSSIDGELEVVGWTDLSLK